MKKILSLLLVLAMLLTPVFALAVENYSFYTAPDGSYSFAYPSEWTLLSKDTFDAVLDVAVSMGDENFTTMVENLRPQIEELGIVVLMSADLSSNINVIAQNTGIEVTPELLTALGEMIPAQLTSQLGESVVFPVEPYLVDVGEGRQVLLVEYTFTMMGYDQYGVQASIGNGTVLHTFTLTTSAEQAEGLVEDLGFVVGSLQVN